MVDPIRPSLTPGVPAVEKRPGLAAAVATVLAEALEPPGPAAAVAVARAEAAGQQASLAPLLANLEQALGSKALPAAVKAAIAQVLDLRTPTDAPITAETVKRAIAGSGLFLEARLAGGEPAPMDVKAALLVLQQLLAPATPRAAPRPQRTPSPPPTAGGALSGQAPAAPTLDAEAEPAAQVHQLRGEVEQALARQTLHQLASRPDSTGAHWMFELPLATPHGSAIAQFAIDRDDAGRGGPEDPPAWQARFSLDLPSLGPVHVSLRMDGERTAVTMWAEDAEGLERLRSRGGELAGALAADVVFRPGSPRPPEPPPGRLVDRSS
jgi:flagellar hook-length control protein FliK